MFRWRGWRICYPFSASHDYHGKRIITDNGKHVSAHIAAGISDPHCGANRIARCVCDHADEYLYPRGANRFGHRCRIRVSVDSEPILSTARNMRIG